MVDERFSASLEDAAKVDSELVVLDKEARKKRCKGQPFLGVPFTTKVT